MINLFSQIPDATWLGAWKGHLDIQGTKLRINFHLKMENGVWTALMDSPDQMQFDIPMDEALIKDNTVRLTLKVANAVYEGTLESDQKNMKGIWKQGVASFPLDLTKDEAHQPRKFPQTPQPPFPYKAEEVTYRNESADIQLGGTITLPEGVDKAPVILLITGSGPQDRDETIAGHKPFWVIADHFSRRGFAVLRVDDRGVGASGGNSQTSTTADFVTDVTAGIKYLKSHPNIDPKRIVLMGHSEGGLIAMMVAAKARKDVAGIVSLAGPGVPIWELMLQQIEDVSRSQDAAEEIVKAAMAYSAQLYKLVREDKKDKLNANTLYEKMKIYHNSLSKEIIDSMELTEAKLMQGCVTVLAPWFRYFIKIDPALYLKKISCPVLAVNGRKDIQVASGPNLEAIDKIVRKNGNKDVTCTEIPELNHLFQTCKTCTVQEYAELEETFSPSVLKAMEGWLLQRFK